jgi:hypothetical protein
MVIISYTNSCCVGSVRITLHNMGTEYELVLQNSDVGTSLWMCERRRLTYRADSSGWSLVSQLLLVLGVVSWSLVFYFEHYSSRSAPNIFSSTKSYCGACSGVAYSQAAYACPRLERVDWDLLIGPTYRRCC